MISSTSDKFNGYTHPQTAFIRPVCQSVAFLEKDPEENLVKTTGNAQMLTPNASHGISEDCGPPQIHANISPGPLFLDGETWVM